MLATDTTLTHRPKTLLGLGEDRPRTATGAGTFAGEEIHGIQVCLRGDGADLVPQPISSQYFQAPRAVANGLFHRFTGVNLGFGAKWSKPKGCRSHVPALPPLQAHSTPAHWVQVTLALYLIYVTSKVRSALVGGGEAAQARAVSGLASVSAAKRLVNHPETILDATLLQVMIYLCDWYAAMCQFYTTSDAATFEDFVASSNPGALAAIRAMVETLATEIEAKGAYCGQADDDEVLVVTATLCGELDLPYRTNIYVATPAPKAQTFACHSYEKVLGVPVPQDVERLPPPSGTVNTPETAVVDCGREGLGMPSSVFVLRTRSARRPKSFTDGLMSTHQTQDVGGQTLFPLGHRLVSSAQKRLAECAVEGHASAEGSATPAAIIPDVARTLVESMFPNVATVLKVREESKTATLTLPAFFTGKDRVRVRARLPEPPKVGSAAAAAAMALVQHMQVDSGGTLYYRERAVARLVDATAYEGATLRAAATPGSAPPSDAVSMASCFTYHLGMEDLLALRFVAPYGVKRAVVALSAFALPGAGLDAMLSAVEVAACVRVPSPPVEGCTVSFRARALGDADAKAHFALVDAFLAGRRLVTVPQDGDGHEATMTLVLDADDTAGLDDRDDGVAEYAAAEGQRLELVLATCSRSGDEVVFASMGEDGLEICIDEASIMGSSGHPGVPTTDMVRPVPPTILAAAAVLAKARTRHQ